MIDIEGIEFSDNEFLKIANLIKLNNILSIQKSQIKDILNSNNFIEEYEVFKRYPSSIEIKIKKTNFLASTNINGKNYLVGSNGKFINTKDYSKNLPFIFGNFEPEKFLEFKSIILQTNFKYNNIKNFYHFPSGRWDIEMISGVLIKLPISGIKESLNLSIELLNDIEFSNIKILDIRQKNQIVTNE
ncbi:cell division protein FtsQ/DivIB [Candidatus Pelagibacter sp.]|uniref:cell division protein FtsQ/DivIB n=1 Tax=Candidatus Pelagibacter sp. TaxID=2024849 RepID=UPI003F86FDA1